MLSPDFIRKLTSKLDCLDSESLKDFVQNLAAERAFFQVIFDSMNEGVLISDQDGLVQYANPTACHLLGKAATQMARQPVLDCIDSIDFFNLVQKALRDNERVQNREVSLYIPSDRILSVSIHLLERGQTVLGHVIIFLDITREKKEKLRLRQAENISALSSLIAGIAHEIKNPLSAIDIHLQLLNQALEGGEMARISRDGGRYLEIIRDEVARLNLIVVDFLSAARPLKIYPELVVLSEFFAELAGFIRPALAEARLELELDLASNLPRVMLDPQLFRQALLNLLNNAQEASQPGSKILLSVGTREDQLEIRVEDQGSGIPEERLGAIFEPYHTTKDFGTGLGLTIVWRIVREHNGEINVESQAGEGTIFTVLIPIRKKATRP